VKAVGGESPSVPRDSPCRSRRTPGLRPRRHAGRVAPQSR
jgi:hypothetical protein